MGEKYYNLELEDFDRLLNIKQLRNLIREGGTKWKYSTEDIAFLRSLLERGASIFHIAKVLEVSTPSIKLAVHDKQYRDRSVAIDLQKLHKELTSHHVSTLGALEIVSAYIEGVSKENLSKVFGVDKEIVSRALYSYNEWAVFNRSGSDKVLQDCYNRVKSLRKRREEMLVKFEKYLSLEIEDVVAIIIVIDSKLHTQKYIMEITGLTIQTIQKHRVRFHTLVDFYKLAERGGSDLGVVYTNKQRY